MNASPIFDQLLSEQEPEAAAAIAEAAQAARGTGIATPDDARAAVLRAFNRTDWL